MGCHCKKSLPSKILIATSLIIMTLFNNTSYSQMVFKIGGMIQIIGIIWFIIMYVLNRTTTCKVKQ
ncbi:MULTISPECIES: hypothetical protein [Enterococcaceae]|uniref:hypothetical protein n=1 Tax=Enterococcaceae TaxID=81852 RepID=UPI000E48DD63|nr:MULTISPECIES: hypothetical protein [Enterococcaceae]MCI0131248.1 hypothetical protein [Vagococcus sp. CY53-2]RGI28723.1 hypothetical protein DXC12_09380 [Melissococcus sp. OM08-11BH]